MASDVRSGAAETAELDGLWTKVNHVVRDPDLTRNSLSHTGLGPRRQGAPYREHRGGQPRHHELHQLLPQGLGPREGVVVRLAATGCLKHSGTLKAAWARLLSTSRPLVRFVHCRALPMRVMTGAGGRNLQGRLEVQGSAFGACAILAFMMTGSMLAPCGRWAT